MNHSNDFAATKGEISVHFFNRGSIAGSNVLSNFMSNSENTTFFG